MEFGKKKIREIDLYLISRVFFAWTFFKFSDRLWVCLKVVLSSMIFTEKASEILVNILWVMEQAFSKMMMVWIFLSSSKTCAWRINLCCNQFRLNSSTSWSYNVTVLQCSKIRKKYNLQKAHCLPQTLKSTFFEIFRALLGSPKGPRSEEKISKNVDFSVWGNRATT